MICSFLTSHVKMEPSSIGLPDAASIEAASWVEPDNDRTVLIDASTAFRVDEEWAYGFPGKWIRSQKDQVISKDSLEIIIVRKASHHFAP